MSLKIRIRFRRQLQLYKNKITRVLPMAIHIRNKSFR